MKTYTKLLVMVASLAVPLVVAGSVLAEDHTTHTTTEPTTTEKRQQTKEEIAAKQHERLEKRKTELKTKLQAAESARLKLKCKASQTILGGLNKRLTTVSANHTKAFDNINTRLNALATRLEAQSINTAQLEEQLTILGNKIVTYKTSLQTYKEAVDDLSTMDCVTDPTAFKASLETARTTREQLTKAAIDIKAYINQTIKPTLAAIRTQLEQNRAEAGETN